MVRTIINAVLFPIERVFFGIELAVVSVRRAIVSDLGTILHTFDRAAADLEAFTAREAAALDNDYSALGNLYDRIDARRANIGRAKAVAQNIQNLTSVQ